MAPIPHGHTPQERRQYAATIKGRATAYYDDRGQWVRVPQNFHPNVVLVEVWAQGTNDVDVHPARNQFFPVTDNQEKAFWHDLATSPRTQTIRKHHPVQQTGPSSAPVGHQQASASSKITPKTSAEPCTWAEADNVIGYTSKTAIDNPTLDSLIKLVRGGRALPSVYYRFGHKTNDHKELDNIGWDDKYAWQRLFFGNVKESLVR